MKIIRNVTSFPFILLGACLLGLGKGIRDGSLEPAPAPRRRYKGWHTLPGGPDKDHLPAPHYTPAKFEVPSGA
jgi:hypothetical protein